jgi:putative PIN family toxin of toxin-antitoxin system
LTRLVIDASALLSGVAGRPTSPPALLLAGMLTRRFVPVVCPNLLDEVRRGLSRAYFKDRVTPEEADHVLRFLTQRSVNLRDPRSPPAILRDPTDDYLVALAITARARAIVSSDKDLLDHPGLHPPALTPRAACELLRLL